MQPDFLQSHIKDSSPTLLPSSPGSTRETMSMTLVAQLHEVTIRTKAPNLMQASAVSQRLARYKLPHNHSAVAAAWQRSNRHHPKKQNEEKRRFPGCVPPPALTHPSARPQGAEMTQERIPRYRWDRTDPCKNPARASENGVILCLAQPQICTQVLVCLADLSWKKLCPYSAA